MGRAIALSLLCIFGSHVVASDSTYPRSGLLIEPADLAKSGEAGQPGHLVILDARPRAAFDKARIPKAIWIDAAAWAKAFGSGQDAKGWSARIGDLGIGPGTKVVVYDGDSFKDAARVWWILRFWGIEDVRLLNGNWLGWDKAGLPIESQKPKPPAPAKFTAVARPDSLATKQQMLGFVKDKSWQIVDARSNAEFCGLDTTKAKRSGAMPGAKHLEWIDLIDKSSQRWKSPQQLAKLFADAGIDLQRPAAAHCQSGGRSSVMAFGMELMGAKDVRNYYASWAEWGNAADTPIVGPKQDATKKDEKKRP